MQVQTIPSVYVNRFNPVDPGPARPVRKPSPRFGFTDPVTTGIGIGLGIGIAGLAIGLISGASMATYTYFTDNSLRNDRRKLANKAEKAVDKAHDAVTDTLDTIEDKSKKLIRSTK